MASQQLPPPPPPPTSGDAASPTTITALGDDLLREIFLRLPSLPSLVRAALACRAFLAAIRSSGAFRRRFRGIHAPPLLGLFFDPDGPAIPTFAPLRRRSDPDLAAAVRGGDFFLTRVPGDHDDTAPGWEIQDCREGRVLLLNPRTNQIAAYDPLTRALDLVTRPPEEITVGCHGYFTYLNHHILPSSEDDEDPGALRVLCTCHDDSRARAAVFSSATGEWQIFPWARAFTRRRGDDKYWLHSGSLVNGCVYWTHTSKPYMLVLNTATMQFSRIDLPQYLKGQGHSFRVGETNDGKPCIVGVVVFSLLIWYWRPDDNGVEKWMLDKMFPLQAEVIELTEGSPEEHAALKVIEIIDGYVYLSTFETFNDPDLACWFMTFCLETAELEKLFHKKYDCHIYPYIMPWPSALLGNVVNPQLEGA
ncbi:hypothetical protein QOZ80_7AG0567930 [Eleusine coracana subsp. coracana]|nr:hypothetical protein QOZ80_7AG0567930 [Eleusine coracana subsp. coracana]